ncbi:MAG: hypothetical protein ABI140_19950 [Jatrophihabitantaceae bacterium]
MIPFRRTPSVRRTTAAAGLIGLVLLVGTGSVFAAPSDPATAAGYHTVTPTRIVDSRIGLGTPKGPFIAGQTRIITVPGVPDDAIALAVNVTAESGTAHGYLTVYGQSSRPGTSTTNWNPGVTVANAATVRIDPAVTGTQVIRIYNPVGSVSVIVDLLGYYAPGLGTGPMGPAGPAGLDGAPGPVGPPGANGIGAGPAGFVYLHAINTVAETVHKAVAGRTLTFSARQGDATSQGAIGFTPGTGSFTIPNDGNYKVTFSVLANESNQFDLRVNGDPIPSGALVFGSTGGEPNDGTAVLTLVTGDVLTLENWTSVGDVVLDTDRGGTAAAINASILIEQLND